MQTFHDLGITHRDLKPGNILLDGSQTPHITDFGLASHRTDPDITVTQDGKVFGTYACMSPEQAAGEVSLIGRSSDIFSMGIVLYEILTGTKPFQAADNEKYGERDAAPDSPVSGYPVDVAILRCKLAGVRLPTTVEWEFVATDRGRTPDSGTAAALPQRRPWNEDRINNLQAEADIVV